MAIYFFDSYLPPRLAKMLGALDVSVVHQMDPEMRESLQDSTSDDRWVSVVRQNGYVLITIDRVSRKDASIALALELTDITAVFLPAGFAKFDRWTQASWLVKNWPDIDEHSRQAPKGAWVRVSLGGKISPIISDDSIE